MVDIAMVHMAIHVRPVSVIPQFVVNVRVDSIAEVYFSSAAAMVTGNSKESIRISKDKKH